MGDVYRAIDTRVGRTVAVKVLPADAAAQSDRRQRFEREARAVARLNHPHICALYDVGQQDGVEFLVMEYLDGETLGARLARGPLPLAEALKHAAALAQALARAHREGITHRDIKPSNIMLTESGVKLLDFGLAKLRDPSTSSGPGAAARHSPLDELSTGTALSPEGTLVGTIAYMSPEQLEGRPVDARTDIYALGLIIYEMVTGQRAFAKGSQAGLIAAILKEEPPPMSAAQPNTPAPLERIVLTALAKDPSKRWQDAGDLARELAYVVDDSHTTSVGTSRRGASRRMPVWAFSAAAAAIVVASIGTAGIVWNGNPIRNLIDDPIGNPIRNPQSALRNLVVLPCRASGDATARAYCDGLTDTLSARMTPLAVSRGLEITSTLEVRRRGVTDATQARREFGATLILEGGIERAGDQLRVNYVLIDATTLRQIDAYSATSPASDPFALQDRVATWAAGVLALQLNGAERQTLLASGTRAPGALELFLQGRGYLLNYQTPGNIDAAIDMFNRAIALDSRYAPAYAGLGGAFWQQVRGLARKPLECGAGALRLRAGGRARSGAAGVAHLPRHHRARHRTVRRGGAGIPARARSGADERRSDPRPRTRAGPQRRRRPKPKRPISARSRSGRTTGRRTSGSAPSTASALDTPKPSATVRAGAHADAGQRPRLLHPLRHVRHRIGRPLRRWHRGVPEIGRRIVPSVAAYSNWGAVLSNLRRFERGDRAIRGGAARRTRGLPARRRPGARLLLHAGRRPEAMTLLQARDRPWSTQR